MAGVNGASLRQVRPTSIAGIGSVNSIVSIRFPSRDHGRNTISDNMATPWPSATNERVASTDEVRNTTFGRYIVVVQYFSAVCAASSTVSITYGSSATSRKPTALRDNNGCLADTHNRRRELISVSIERSELTTFDVNITAASYQFDNRPSSMASRLTS